MKYGKNDHPMLFAYKENLIWKSAQERSADILVDRWVDQGIPNDGVEGGVHIQDKV